MFIYKVSDFIFIFKVLGRKEVYKDEGNHSLW